VKVFLAGTSGAAGRLIVPQLVAAGHLVSGTTRSPEKFAGIAASGARPVALNVLDRAATLAALQAERPDVVIHMLTDLAGLDFAANSRLRQEGTRNLVDAAQAVGVQRMIGESISWVYAPGAGPAREGQPLDLNAPLPRGRMVAVVNLAEQAVAEMPVGVILRCGIFYGPGTWYARDGLTTKQIFRGEIEATDGLTSFIHVADVAQATLQALHWPAGVVNIVDDQPAPGTEWVPLYASLVGAPPPPLKPGSQPWERGESNSKARGLGWIPAYPSWRQGFKSALA
jgi:nucleoside-diphosphate-sugar epimerase